MVSRDELQTLFDNMDESASQILIAIAVKMSTVAAERWTGKVEFTLNTCQGKFGDCPISTTEVFKPKKNRMVRG